MSCYLVFSACSDVAYEVIKEISPNNTVILEGRNEERLKELASEFNCKYYVNDVCNFETTAQIFEEVKNENEQIDGVLCFAGSLLLKPAHLTSKEDLMNVLNSNVVPAFSVVHSCGKFLRDASVILFSSAIYDLGLANHEAISLAKGGIASLVKSASSSYAGKNIRFNAVAPGMTETKLTAKILQSEAGKNASIKMHPLNRVAKPEEIASLACYLLSQKASFITGQTFKIDGGLASIKL
jgi:3-oxoacyl-[acyl-carrier protein] reductase